ncbi:MAG: hypothetical protein WD097_09920 [Balneolales bacterium]
MNFYQQIYYFCLIFLFVTSCSSTQKISSQFTEIESTPQTSANLSSQMADVERHWINGLAFQVTNDETNLYIMVDFVQARTYQLAREFGFTIYIDDKSNYKRSFGITYPTGIYYELGNYPGARNGYLLEPNWGNLPENQSVIQAAISNITNNVLLIQRRSRRDDFQPTPIPLAQLRAQNLFVHIDDNARSGRISLTIPMEIRSTSQFSPDIRPGDIIDLGFEINPLRLLNMEQTGNSSIITSDTASGRTRSEDPDQNRNIQILNRLGEPFEKWVEVTLAKPGT